MTRRCGANGTASMPGVTTLLGNLDARLRPFWHPVAFAGDVVADQLTRVDLLGESWVVWRDAHGTAHALRDRCPHRYARLSAGCLEADGTIRCGYHGWRFDARGAVVEIPSLATAADIPARAAAPTAYVHEACGLVFIAPEAPDLDVLDVPEWGTLPTVWLPTRRIATTAGQFIDNFCDFAHFPFVHAGTFGTGADRDLAGFELEPTPDGYRQRGQHLAQNTEDPEVATGNRPLVQPRIMEYSYTVPFSARLRIEYPLSGMVNTIVTWVQPATERESIVFTAMIRNDVHDTAAEAAARDYELAILEEDVRILEQSDALGFELDIRRQFHVRADRATVELRRALSRRLGAATDETGGPDA